MLAISIVIISMLHVALQKFLETQAFFKAGGSGSTCVSSQQAAHCLLLSHNLCHGNGVICATRTAHTNIAA